MLGSKSDPYDKLGTEMSQPLTLLFTVEDAFQIADRYCILVPGIPPTSSLPSIRVGDLIRLVKPNGEAIETHIHGVELLNYGQRPRPAVIHMPISLPPPITKQDVPPGTQVFYVGARSTVGRIQSGATIRNNTKA